MVSLNLEYSVYFVKNNDVKGYLDGVIKSPQIILRKFVANGNDMISKNCISNNILLLFLFIV